MLAKTGSLLHRVVIFRENILTCGLQATCCGLGAEVVWGVHHSISHGLGAETATPCESHCQRLPGGRLTLGAIVGGDDTWKEHMVRKNAVTAP